MKFTDRFISLPIKVYNKQNADVMGKTEYIDTHMKILPFEISDYKATFDEENDDQECVSLTLKNGNNAYVYLTFSEFEKALNDHDGKVYNK